MNLVGTIVQILPLEQGISKSTGNPWSKATIVIETESQYPKKVAMSNMKNAEEFLRLPIGAKGTFKIDVSSQEYKGRWFTSVNCYQWELEGQQAPPQQQYAQPQSQPQMSQGGYAPSPQTGYQQPPQGYTQGYQQPYAQPPQNDDNIPF